MTNANSFGRSSQRLPLLGVSVLFLAWRIARWIQRRGLNKHWQCASG